MLKLIFAYVLLINSLFYVRGLNQFQLNDHQNSQSKDPLSRNLNNESKPIYKSVYQNQLHLNQHRLFKRHSSHDGTKRRRIGHAMNKHEFFYKKNYHHRY